MGKHAPWDAPDDIAVRLVVEDGHRMPLIGSDRIEAMRRMAARGVNAQDIADALMIKRSYATKLASDHGVSLPSTQPPMHWTRPYVDKSQLVRKPRRSRK